VPPTALAAPHPVDSGFDLGLHAADEFAIGGDQGLFGFDLGDDGAINSPINGLKNV